jgi:hypothetical protein
MTPLPSRCLLVRVVRERPTSVKSAPDCDGHAGERLASVLASWLEARLALEVVA